jgi:hypothetical protein
MHLFFFNLPLSSIDMPAKFLLMYTISLNGGVHGLKFLKLLYLHYCSSSYAIK